MVTVGAMQRLMCAGQRKMRLRPMVEFPNSPAIRRMALRAVFAKAALMNVVVLVTADALGRGILESLARMALCAMYDGMKAG